MNDYCRWTDDELGFVADPPVGMSLREIAETLGRSYVSVKSKRAKLLQGWAPSGRFSPLSDDEVDFIRQNPDMTAAQSAEALGVTMNQVLKCRSLVLIQEEGQSFSLHAPGRSPHAPGERRLVAKTCNVCGVIRGGADFHRRGKMRLDGTCRHCHLASRIRVPDSKSALEAHVQALAVVYGVPYRSKNYDEYTEADMRVLGNPNLTVSEKAAQLGRTYAAVSAAAQRYGLTESREERLESGGVWIIDRVA